MRCYILLYSSRHHHDIERPPGWLGNEGICRCDSAKARVVFIEALSLPCDKEEQERLINTMAEAADGVRFIHYFEAVLDTNVVFPTQDIVKISYSSADPYYGEMWRDIRSAKDCRELAERLEYWIAHYIIDPIRRIKHRTMNLFAPLDTDCQYLLELWECRDYDAARRHLEDIQKDWQGDPPYSNAPLSKLARLWYMLVGKGMKWPHFVRLGYISPSLPFGGVSVESPEKVVSLPEGGVGKEREQLCLHLWLSKVGKDEDTEWNNILRIAGLNCSNHQFEPDTNAGIYRFAVELQKRLIQGSLPNLRPDTSLQGFEGCSTVEANFRKFREWLRGLNEAFEALVEEFSGQIKVQAR